MANEIMHITDELNLCKPTQQNRFLSSPEFNEIKVKNFTEPAHPGGGLKALFSDF